MCVHCKSLIKAIDNWIIKADNDLEDKLSEEGYVQPKETVDEESKLEDKITDAEAVSAALIVSAIDELSENDSVTEFYCEKWPEIKNQIETDEDIATVVKECFDKLIPMLTEAYLQQTDKELVLQKVTDRTNAWIENWSGELGELMKLETADELEKILLQGIDDGLGIEKIAKNIQDAGIRDVRYKARRVALTEVLRAHSTSANEAIMQSPVVDRKCWRHTGAGKTPRPGHIVLDGTIIGKNESFTLVGKNGTYYPKYPRDTILPAGESINCHCLLQAVVSDEALGMPVEDRWELQRKTVEDDDKNWEKELNQVNREKAEQWRKEHGLYVPTKDGKSQLNYIKSKTKQGQIKHLGTKNRWALIESGVIKDDKDLAKLYDTKIVNGKSVPRRKTLTELKDDGIITIDSKVLKHSVEGDFTALGNPKKPPSCKNGGRPKGGGHSQKGLDILDEKGWSYEITKTYDNGVRIGNSLDHDKKWRRTGSQMSWFPEDWTEDDILVAGTYTANKGIAEAIEYKGVKSADRLTAQYNGVTVCVTKNLDGDITTIYPANKQ